MHYKKQVKRLHMTHKLLSQQRDLLRAMQLEGITAVTFYTTTRQLTLPNEERAATESAAVYEEWWSKRRKDLKAEVQQVNQQWAADKQRTSQQCTNAAQ